MKTSFITGWPRDTASQIPRTNTGDCILSDKKPAVTAEDVRVAWQVVLAAYESEKDRQQDSCLG